VLAQHTGDSTPLIDSAMNVGSTPTVLAVAGGIKAHGPNSDLTVALSLGYQVDVRSKHEAGASGFGAYRPDGSEVVLRVSVIGSDGARRELKWSGLASGSRGGGPAMQFSERVPVDPTATVQAVEISADAVTRVVSVMWWSGDRSKRIEWP
jgi:hypothetical protein